MVNTNTRQLVSRVLISIVLSAAILLFLFHLAGLQPPEQGTRPFTQVISAVLWPLAALYVVTQFAQTWLRALRYHLFLRAEGGERLPSRGFIFLVTLVRNMLVDLVPARIGELGYVIMLNRGYQVPATACLSSLGLSVIFDVVALVAVMAVLLALSRDLTVGLQMPALVGAIVVALGFTLYFGAALMARICIRIAQWFEAGWWHRAAGFIGRIFESVHRVRHARVLTQVLLYSFSIRVFTYGGLYLLFLAVTWNNYPELVAAPLWQIVTAFIGAEAAASLPVPAFMSFGTYEAGGLAALTLLGFAPVLSITIMFAVHLLSQIADYLLGAAGLAGFVFTAGRNRNRS